MTANRPYGFARRNGAAASVRTAIGAGKPEHGVEGDEDAKRHDAGSKRLGYLASRCRRDAANDGFRPPIIEQRHAQHDGEDVEEVVVPGREDERFEEYEAAGGNESDIARQEDAERQRELDDECHPHRPLEDRRRQMVDIPRECGWQGLGFEVEGEGGAVGPGGISARELDEARQEHETEQRQPRQPHAEPGCAGQHGGDDEAFDEEDVPLVGQEDLAGGKKRQIAHVGGHRSDAAPASEQRRQRRERADRAYRVQGHGRGIEPEDRGQEPETFWAVGACERIEIVSLREALPAAR